MAREFVTSDRLLALGIGPAGAGKTSLTVVAGHCPRRRPPGVRGRPDRGGRRCHGRSTAFTATTVDAFRTRDLPLAVGMC
ncbi:hypothetical protein QJS66_23670 (plasmid) [Kocuria rhizophila]|nr:hypothetical protein QJS66_23670 [Kocuria rhizophila]